MPTTEPDIPSIFDLIRGSEDLGYQVTQPDGQYTLVYLELNQEHKLVISLVQYALLTLLRLLSYSYFTAGNEVDFSSIRYDDIRKSIEDLRNKPCRHYRGWIGEIISHFVLQHFLIRHRELLDYKWERIQLPKAEVTEGEIDIVAAYELSNRQFGHVAGEVKTYKSLSSAKSAAYSRLDEVYTRNHKRGDQIRGALIQILGERSDVNPVQAALTAMGEERTFLPGILHCSDSIFKRKATFEEIVDKFSSCTRPSQRIGFQIVIDGFGSECNDDSLIEGFFEDFLRKMHCQAVYWKQEACWNDPARCPYV